MSMTSHTSVALTHARTYLGGDGVGFAVVLELGESSLGVVERRRQRLRLAVLVTRALLRRLGRVANAVRLLVAKTSATSSSRNHTCSYTTY